VEGYFTAKVATNVYDTATGRHLFVPQGSTILGHDQSSTLLYGNERLPTISLTLALPDGRSGSGARTRHRSAKAFAGLTGKVDQHSGGSSLVYGARTQMLANSVRRRLALQAQWRADRRRRESGDANSASGVPSDTRRPSRWTAAKLCSVLLTSRSPPRDCGNDRHRR